MESLSVATVPTTVSPEEAPVVDYLEAVEAGRADVVGALLHRYPSLAEQAEAFLAAEAQLDRLFAPLAPAIADREPILPPGTRVNDYVILEYLARGGMGVVYRARQDRPEREVALKMLRRRTRMSSGAPYRLLFGEAGHAARLDHPNIVPIYGVGEYQGEPYFSMKLVQGGSLAYLPPGLADDANQVARLLATIARAVHHAHQRGVLHRDLKPANILLHRKSENQNPKSESEDRRPGSNVGVRISDLEPLVSDFGLAQQIGTVSEGTAGTLAYMAPEQVRGEPVLSVAVDVYGLGAILYELLTGRPPCRSAGEEPVPPHAFWPRVPRDLDAICLRCLKEHPEKRYNSAEALARDLDRFLQRRPVLARPRSAAGVVGLWLWRQPTQAVLLAAFLVLACLGIGFLVQLGKAADAQDKRDRALYVSTIHQAHQALADSQPNTANTILDQCPQQLHDWEYHYLRRACRRQVLILAGHEGQVLRVQYSPDGRYLVTEGEDGLVKLWDPAIGCCLWSQAAASACFSCDSRWLLTVGWTQATSAGAGRPNAPGAGLTAAIPQPVMQWEIEKIKSAKPVPALAKPVRLQRPRLVAARAAPWVACLDRRVDGQACLYVWQLGQPRPSDIAAALGLAGSLPNLWQVGWTAETMALAQTSPTRLLVESSPGQKQPADRPASKREVIDLALSPDGHYLAAGGHAGLLVVWDLRQGQRREFHLPEWAGVPYVWAVAFSADSRYLATGLVRPIIWDMNTGKPMPPPYSGTAELTCFSLAFGANDRLLAATFRDGHVRVWDRDTHRAVLSLPKNDLGVTSAVFSPDGKLGSRLAWTRGREVVIENLGRPTSPPELKLVGHEDKALWSVAFSPDGNVLASRSTTEVILWSRDSGQPLWRKPLNKVVPAEPAWQFREAAELPDDPRGTGKFSACEAPLCFSPDGRWLVTGARDRLQAWDVKTGRVAAVPVPAANTRFHAFGMRDRDWLLAVSDGTNAVQVWTMDGATMSPGHPVAIDDAGVGEVRTLAFAPAGRARLAVCGSKGLKVHDLSKNAPGVVLSFPNSTDAVWCVAFSQDGKRLATGGATLP